MRTRFKHHPRGPLPSDHIRPFGAEITQGADPPHIALAPGRDAFDCPTCFGFDLAVELVAGEVFLFPGLIAPGLEMRETLLLPPHLTPVDPKRGAGQRGQKCPVVRDQHIGRAGLRQFGFQPTDRLNVEMVGRLIEQHQLRRLGQKLGQRRAPPLTARGLRHIGLKPQFQPGRRRFDPPSLIRTKIAQRIIAEGRIALKIRLLLHIARMGPGRQSPGALVGFNKTRHHLEKCGFSRTIPAD